MSKQEWHHETFVDAVQNHRYTLACTPSEFGIRFGFLPKATKEQQEEVMKLACLCKDGIIRPR